MERPSAHKARRAAQYLRMSTENQQFSLASQKSAISRFAEARSYEIVETYEDSGISGLHLKGRAGLQRLLRDVMSGAAAYSVILVYDVSRWGRFQDPDQAAHYEFLCRDAGLAVEYCSEVFENDGSLVAQLLKSLKRVEAADFSRKLGQNVLAAQLACAAKGFKQGGPAPYGLRRMMVDADGHPKQVLNVGEYKALRTDRTVTVLGPPEEVALVRRIFSLFVIGGMTRTAIAAMLNSEGIPSRLGVRWLQSTLTALLRNEAYAGVLVFNRTTQRLGAPSRLNKPSDWVRIEGAIPAIVSPELFAAAQRAIGGKFRRLSDDQMLAQLRDLLEDEGQITWDLIKQREGMPCPQTYRDRFGTITRAMELVGYCGLRFHSGAVARRIERAGGVPRLFRSGRGGSIPAWRPDHA